ncbi:hypothetical protein GF377_03465 [candidate division GN15 bacterium]|nr:hypothetical protein [candidate division GN15 bacterium]
MKTRIAHVLLLLTLTLTGCNDQSGTATDSSSQDDTDQPLRTPAELTADELAIVSASNDFAVDFFRGVCGQTPSEENVFVSPLSASYALTMTANGCAGPTRDSMLHALALEGMTIDEINEGYHQLARILTQADPAVNFSIANSFWSRQGKAIQPEYIDMANTFYDARVEEVDITQPWVADTINQWVEDKTAGKIKDMVASPLDFAAMLLNAIYFKADWRYPFDTADTRERDFRLSDGTNKVWETMHLAAEDVVVDTSFPPVYNPDITVFANQDLSMISLPYGDEGFEMLVIVPDSSTTVDDFVADMTLADLTSWIDQLHVERFWLSLPKIRFSFESMLNDVLIGMGMGIAFTPGMADFGNMFVDGVGWIDQVKQKAFVQVDEHGTEAAAVTQVIVADSLPPVIDATRPFVFMIREAQSGTILFMAKIAEPMWEE